MTTEQVSSFESFVREISHQTQVEIDPEEGYFRLDLNGVPFMFAHEPQRWGEDHVLCACDFGPIPQENRCAILERILAANSELHAQFSPTFTVDPDSKHLLAMSMLPLQGLGPAQTMHAMLGQVALAEAWKNNYFLEAESV